MKEYILEPLQKIEKTYCKCGEPFSNHRLVSYYKKRDGTLSKYVQYDKRCQKCINKGKYVKKKRQPSPDKERNYAY
jgi:hypothetical protein